MKIVSSRTFWGTILIIGGILFLLDNFGILKGGELFWGCALGLVGIFLLSMYTSNREQWWWIIPGFIFLASGILLIISGIFPDFDDRYGGVIFLGGIGISFILVYLFNRTRWWAIIPGGILITLAIVAGVERLVSENILGGIFFLGLGITFFILGFLPAPDTRMRWAGIPALVMIILGAFLFLVSKQLSGYALPIILFAVGGILIWRALQK